MKGSGTEYIWRQECLGPLRKILLLGNKPFGTRIELLPRLTTLWGVSSTPLRSILKISLEKLHKLNSVVQYF